MRCHTESGPNIGPNTFRDTGTGNCRPKVCEDNMMGNGKELTLPGDGKCISYDDCD